MISGTNYYWRLKETPYLYTPGLNTGAITVQHLCYWPWQLDSMHLQQVYKYYKIWKNDSERIQQEWKKGIQESHIVQQWVGQSYALIIIPGISMGFSWLESSFAEENLRVLVNSKLSIGASWTRTPAIHLCGKKKSTVSQAALVGALPVRWGKRSFFLSTHHRWGCI